MWGITIKNILKNKMLSLCLSIGFILSIAVVCAVPMYSNSVLDNYITVLLKSAGEKSLQEAEAKSTIEEFKPNDTDSKNKENVNTKAAGSSFEQAKRYIYPAGLTLTKNFRFNMSYEDFLKEYNIINSSFYQEAKKISIPTLAQKTTMTFQNIKYNYTKNGNIYFSSYNKMKYVSGINEYITVKEGKLPSEGGLQANTVETIVDEATFKNFSLELNKPYKVLTIDNKNPLYMKVVGIFDVKDKTDKFWADRDNEFYCEFLISEKGFLGILKNNSDYMTFVENMTCSILYDADKINNKNAAASYKMINNLTNVFKNRASSSLTSTLANNLKEYVEKEAVYNTVVWMFLIPVIIVVIFYIWMVSNFIVKADSDQIAVLKSRGASKFEIIKLYFYEGLILSGVGIIVGPMLGVLLCKAISYSDGFLVFSSQQAINISSSNKIYLYSVMTAAILLAALLIAVFSATQRSIVEVKQAKNRYIKRLFKNKYMDIILLSFAVYGYYNYGVSKNIAVLSNTKAEKAPIDPLLYLISTIFIIGAGMFLLRIYRYLITFVFKLWKSKYPTAIYISIINVIRSHLKKSAAMLFVVITVATAIFDMQISKDINTSYTNTITYSMGADFIVKGKWTKEVEKAEGIIDNGVARTTYHEPPYTQYSNVEGIEGYTKVLKAYNGVALIGSGNGYGTNIMGIIPHEFGKVAYFDGYLLKTHWYNYLNAMTKKQNYVLLSTAMAQSLSAKPGDSIYYKIGPGMGITGIVLDIVDYWPSYGSLKSMNLVIGNFNYIFKHTTMYPYEIWIRKKEGVPVKTVYDSMKEEGLQLTEFKSLPKEMFIAKSDVFLKGTNAILNLSFLAIAAVTMLGFIIYWMISLKSRTLSFGIYRSLGLSSKGITITLILEQLFTLGSSILVGALVGNIVGKLFLPIIKDLWYKNKFVVPAKNLEYFKEYLQLGAILFVIFIVSSGILRSYIGKLRIHQAVKLGED